LVVIFRSTATSTDGLTWVAKFIVRRSKNIYTGSNQNNITLLVVFQTATPAAGTASAVSWTGNGPLGI
jgi:hypothetical protein